MSRLARTIFSLLGILAISISGIPWRVEPIGEESGCCSKSSCCCAQAEGSSCCSGDSAQDIGIYLSAACGCGGHSQEVTDSAHRLPAGLVAEPIDTFFPERIVSIRLVLPAQHSRLPDPIEPPPPRHS